MSETISMATEESAPVLSELGSPVLATDSVGEDTWASEGSLPTEPIRPVTGLAAGTPTTYIDPRVSYHLVEEPGHPTRYRIANVGSESRVVAASPFLDAAGVDNRVRITNTTMWPWSPHAHLVKGGDSGAGVFGTWSGTSGEHVCADHVAGPNGVPNTGCRMTGSKGDRIVKEWFPAEGPSPHLTNS